MNTLARSAFCVPLTMQADSVQITAPSFGTEERTLCPSFCRSPAIHSPEPGTTQAVPLANESNSPAKSQKPATLGFRAFIFSTIAAYFALSMSYGLGLLPMARLMQPMQGRYQSRMPSLPLRRGSHMMAYDDASAAESLSAL